MTKLTKEAACSRLFDMAALDADFLPKIGSPVNCFHRVID